MWPTLIGLENYRKLVDIYAGELIYIPKADSFDRLVRNQKIVDEFDGATQENWHGNTT